MSRRTTIQLAIIVAMVAVVAVVVGVIVAQGRQARDEAAPTGGPAVIREDTHRLDVAEDGKVTLVEFLDFECESCGAFYPHVEQLREDFAGQITYAIRYFPLPGHPNSVNAALAAEAAAQQGALHEMYQRMFETQTTWSHNAQSQAHIFRGYAEEMGLDMDQFDADVADPATLERVQSDFEEGRALGVSSTPTFFLNGELVELTSLDGLRAAVQAELDG